MSTRGRGQANTLYRGNKIKTTKLDVYFSLYIRIRDKWTCQRCRRVFTPGPGSQGLDNSHFIGRANRATRWEPDNCDAMCRGCHSYLETHKPTLYRDWKIEQLGEERFEALVELSRGRLGDYGTKAEQVRELLRSVNGGLLAFKSGHLSDADEEAALRLEAHTPVKRVQGSATEHLMTTGWDGATTDRAGHAPTISICW